MRKFLIGCLIAFMFILESIFVELLPGDLFSNHILVPHFLIITIFFFSIYANRNAAIIYAFVFGLLVDVVYTEVLGIYFFVFPFTIYICSKIMKVLHANLLVVSVISLLGITILEMIVYEINFLIHLTSMEFIYFLQLRLVPTLILNAIFLLIAAYPYKRIFEKYAGEGKD
ncbi:rod shape-determining protein MreD [Niallia taxi]|uniref:Rod shape-determining protein MreD n=1 Tax=Niallia taxi TaxID=2499688 RepID=A0A437KDW6_9BACI|nr:rod shape-determining protein MreD [Niallia taxi]MCM3215210.1 rod shape-determining protein MreD [Niallia taxi]MCT2343146.1 rod shape-determining protein MreD [Niallia taxi]MDK8639511.1 rod shape-determining protein MreD [Niallia taxi]MED3962188.1 rod shape-determining protein MreD [Niallia taxi]MED4037458.1 rod shape-determining protein MreD [Niallia taxi]